MPVGRDFERVPRDDHRARLFLAVKTQKEIGKTENRAGRFSSAAQDGLWQCVIGAVREGIAVDDEKRTKFRDANDFGALCLAGALLDLYCRLRLVRGGAWRSSIHAGA